MDEPQSLSVTGTLGRRVPCRLWAAESWAAHTDGCAQMILIWALLCRHAHRSRTGQGVQQAVAGQAGSVAAQARDVVRLDYQGGTATRRGQWVVPARMEIRAVGGTVKLDFTNAVITRSTLQIQAYVRGGGLVLVTKPGIEVDAEGVTVRGGTVKIRPRNGWEEPAHLTVEVSGENHGGRVTARPPRRTFRQWLLRRPRPHARLFRD
jgi:hypothetical protein